MEIVKTVLTILTAAVFGVAAGPALADAPRVNAKTLLGFCSGDESYGPHAFPGCLHYVNGVLDAVHPNICAPLDQSSALLRDALAAWLRSRSSKGSTSMR